MANVRALNIDLWLLYFDWQQGHINAHHPTLSLLSNRYLLNEKNKINPKSSNLVRGRLFQSISSTSESERQRLILHCCRSCCHPSISAFLLPSVLVWLCNWIFILQLDKFDKKSPWKMVVTRRISRAMSTMTLCRKWIECMPPFDSPFVPFV